jgi:hypothetical protein
MRTLAAASLGQVAGSLLSNNVSWEAQKKAHLAVMAAVVINPHTQLSAPPDLLQLLQRLQWLQRLLLRALQHAATFSTAWRQPALTPSLRALLLLLPGHINQACNGMPAVGG